MLRSGAFLLAWLVTFPALAGMPPGMRNPQVRPANAIAGTPAVDDNLGAGGYPVAGGVCAEWGHQVPCNNHYSIVRASTKYVSASDGIYASIPAAVFGLGSGNGGSIEEGRINDALWSRDMTNAAWVKTTMTTALNAVGIDGTANSATTLTATGASAMVVQTITLASQADNYSVFLKRVTGSGTINLCLAATACGTATACTVTSTTTFTRCTVTATVLNPIVGIQIATNGDAVIADFNQMEPGGFPTSPMFTTTAVTTRSADAISLIGSAAAVIKLTTGWILAAAQGTLSPITNNCAIISAKSDLSTAVYLNTGSNNTASIRASGSDAIATFGSGTRLGTTEAIQTWGTSLNRGSMNAGTVVGNTSTHTFDTPSIGESGGVFYYDGYFSRLSVGTTTLPDASLVALTR